MKCEHFKVVVASVEHLALAEKISEMIAEAAQDDSSGLALRSPEYLREKMMENKAVIAFCNDELAGFCYIELWSDKSFIANSGLIVYKKFRGQGLSKLIKEFIFNYSRKNFPKSKIFGLTTDPRVMKINSSLGYRPVAYNDLTQDKKFWDGCKTCANFDILKRMKQQRCLCTAMLFDPDLFDKEDEHTLNKQSVLEESYKG